ncbi:unnamed protein product [Cladocopium goreaui]|uniref:Endonuclease/exonuclease/phosphatase domain-containing protein n=1 Tax=Cladocopium goreaui TaxID=2562237 RepID=A0A9P1GAW1_9DINO|nr:unnamed protein product [Cladocopium goreaui]
MNCPNAMVYQVPILVPMVQIPTRDSTKSSQEEEVSQGSEAATATTVASNSSGEGSKNAVSLLQEYVQTSKRGYRQPQNRATLQWKFDASSSGSKRLFRARVAFVLDGIPHHVMGGWHPRKKLAQQDTASGCLSLFVGEWGNCLSHPDLPDMPDEALPALQSFCRSYPPICDSTLNGDINWTIERLPSVPASAGAYRALLKIQIFDVPHTFAGCLCRTPDAAKADTASRFLWYLQCPKFENLYDIDLVAVASEKLESPSSQWQLRDNTPQTGQSSECWKGAKGDASLAETCKQIELLLENAESAGECP